MRWLRLERYSAMAPTRVASGSAPAEGRYASRCIDPEGGRTEISVPGTKRTPRRSAAAAASARPESVSWSVSASVPMPSAWACSSSAAGESVPSEADEWQWRSRLRR